MNDADAYTFQFSPGDGAASQSADKSSQQSDNSNNSNKRSRGCLQ